MLLTPAKIAKLSGVNASTIRYYVKHGLLEPVDITDSNYTIFSPGSIERVKIIKELQEQNYTLEQIKKMLKVLEGDKA